MLSDQFFLDGQILYRLASAQKRKLQRVKPLNPRVCVPKIFRHELIKYQHEILGHFGVTRTFLTLSNRVYWQDLYKDVREFCLSCDTCLRSKRNYSHKVSPLHPFEVAQYPFQIFHMDHKILSRKTHSNNTALLVFIDAFSNFSIIRPVPDTSALTLARVFVESVISLCGIPEILISDRGSAFTAAFFKEVTRILGITHRTSAVQAPRTNGLAENVIGRISQMLKVYATNDLEIESVIPILEMSLRANAHTRLGVSPFEIIHGFPMRVSAPAEINPSPSFTGEPLTYLRWLQKELKDLHDQVRIGKEQIKMDDKIQYDKQNNAMETDWKVGQKVLLLDKRVRPHSDTVVTHRPFNGPYFIADIVQSCPSIGRAFKLIHVDSGKSMKQLVSGDRLKPYSSDRVDFTHRLPRLLPDRPNRGSQGGNLQSDNNIKRGYEPA